MSGDHEGADGGVVVERRGPALLVGLDRPAKRNALDEATVARLHAVLQEAKREPCVVVVHSTTPGIFAAGADIAELLDRDASDALRGINSGLMDALEAHPWPTVAAVDGPALGGGCELALACDLRIGSERARFAQPEPSLGIIAGAGANWRLPQVVGLPVARRMLYAGEVLDAAAAHRAGLLDHLHDADALLDEAVALAERIATRSWRALELTKMALRVHRPATTGFDVLAQSVLFEDPEKRARMSAFLDERERRRTGGGDGLNPRDGGPG
ncbi:enoyl-CoA hydratase/isomerase family protein [Actinotalea sp. Marseille-Q4924]|uniref:enoyl-CoA hydratase/isomerase family protein n=1 Tax=Actinotalea sp. Marseille-Q4924 TaxID=2866571 RepID=UPI001CE3DE68|nr:enoyl-CoA hydratase/isomerase family protein [Actinotalea sp. Marseille-Q4924]